MAMSFLRAAAFMPRARRLAIALVAGATCALLLQSCDAQRSAEVRYRITVQIDTPEGLRTGSSVWSFALRPGGLVSAQDSRFRGEAIAVDLSGGRALFGILVGRDRNGGILSGEMAMLPETVHRRIGLTRNYEREVLGDRVKVLRYILALPRQPILDCASQAPVECPLLVTFRNTSDPRTVEAVPHDQLQRLLGLGYRLRAILFEITDDRPQFDLQQRLPWLAGTPETSLKPGHGGHDLSLPATLHLDNFQRR